MRVFEFTKTHFQQIRFVQDWFDYADSKIEKDIPVETGYAGFKLLHPRGLNESGGALNDSQAVGLPMQ